MGGSRYAFPMTLSRDAAWALLTEWTQSESLRKHALAVEAAVRGYARQQGANEEEWAVVALLHDFDYEKYPTLGDHPNKGCEHLRSLGYPEWVMRAILSHASEITGIEPESPVEKTLVACDELAGFVTAASLVPAVEEHPRPRGGLGDQADEGQGVRPTGPTRAPQTRCGADGAPAGSARHQCHWLHARTGGCTGSARNALTLTPVYSGSR